MLQKEKVDELVCKRLKLDLPAAKMTEWKTMVDHIISPKHKVRLAVVGKYIEHQDAYKSIYESLTHAGAAANTAIEILRVEAEEFEKPEAAKKKDLEGIQGIL